MTIIYKRGSNMNNYCFSWYNPIAQAEQVDFIHAKDMHEAKQIAVMVMRFFGGKKFEQDDIDSIIEVDERYYYTLDNIINRYKRAGKEVEIPIITDDEEDDEDEDS